MSKFIILECNRDRAIDLNAQDELTDEFKNKWTCQVSNSGIVVNSGDVLTVEQTIINSKGASTEVMEFSGQNNANGVVDNKVRLEIAYYVNNTGKNSCAMPFVNHRTFRGVGDLRHLATNTGVTADGRNTYVAGDQRLPYTTERFKNMISDRSLGETFFLSFPFANNPPGPGEFPDPYDSTIPYDNRFNMPNRFKVFRMDLKTRGGGVANNPDSGYSIGVNSVLTTDTKAIGTTMLIRINSVEDAGSIPNIIENFDIEYFGDKEFSGIDANGDPSTISVSLEGKAGTTQVYEVQNVISDNYRSSDIRRFDGRKYYLLDHKFTGLAYVEDAFISRTDDAPIPNITADFDLNKIVSQPTLRTSNVELEIPRGFQTPDNLANILSEQLGRPEQIDITNNVAQFLDTEKIAYTHANNIVDFAQKDNPNIIASQVYQPTSCNFVNSGKDVPTNGSFAGRRSTFYQSIAWLEPERWTGLVPAFRQFTVENSYAHRGNDLSINYGTRSTGVDEYGDFTRQGVGEFGCHSTIISDIPTVGTNEVNMQRGYIFVSNIRYTQKNINRLVYLKKCEKYMGDLSLKVDTNTQNFRDFLSVNLDVGMYDDEQSTQGPLTTNGQSTDGELIGQRSKFNTIDEALLDNFCISPVDRGFERSLNGFQRDLNNLKNSGQDLSNIWIKSRWNDGFAYKNGAPKNDTTIRFQDSFNSWYGGARWNSANTNIDQVFGEGYVDYLSSEYITIDAMNQMAKTADLAIVPVNVPLNPNDPAQNSEQLENDFVAGTQPPFIGFVVACNNYTSTASVFDPVKQFSDVNNYNWVIDASNCKFGMMFGFDPSFTRNKAICLQNNQSSSVSRGQKTSYLNYMNIGANSPQIKFDLGFSRFSISGLNTPEFIGNGLTTDEPINFKPADDPQQQVVTINRKHQITPSIQKVKGTLPANTPPVPGTAEPIQIGQFNGAQQETGTFIDSQSGVALTKIHLYDEDNNIVATLDPDNHFNSNDYLFHNTLLNKMGFSVEALLPKYGGSNAFFRDPTLFNDTDTYQKALQNIMKPLSTGADINASISGPMSLNFTGAPLFDLGGDLLETATKPDAVQGEITASKLPNKFDFSYLTINSSLVQEGTDTIYIGGQNNYSTLPCMTYLTRENNESDFFYQNERSFTFTATKDFVVTDITTDIRLPNGGRPRLDAHSTIIYKIEKPLTSLAPQSQRVEQAVRQHERQQKIGSNLRK